MAQQCVVGSRARQLHDHAGGAVAHEPEGGLRRGVDALERAERAVREAFRGADVCVICTDMLSMMFRNGTMRPKPLSGGSSSSARQPWPRSLVASLKLATTRSDWDKEGSDTPLPR